VETEKERKTHAAGLRNCESVMSTELAEPRPCWTSAGCMIGCDSSTAPVPSGESFFWTLVSIVGKR
jgi:hypothetical protein